MNRRFSRPSRNIARAASWNRQDEGKEKRKAKFICFLSLSRSHDAILEFAVVSTFLERSLIEKTKLAELEAELDRKRPGSFSQKSA